ncbi:MAG: response regulator [Alphaproteobacteria bacterium]|nr:response regulator [Alphaproteobacteria bacterium]MCB9974521.1 response regulator [Rhodospirillales bacterium]
MQASEGDIIKILMVDDSETDYVLTRMNLETGRDFRHKMDWAGSFADGLAAMKKNEHDIYIVDYKLDQGKSGLDVVREIRLLGIATPVILLTGLDMRKISKEECDKLNISRCLSKHDNDPTLLISIIADTVLHYRAERGYGDHL